MSWSPRVPTDPYYPQPYSRFRDPYNPGDDDSELGLPRSRDVQSARIAGGYAAEAPSTNPARRGGTRFRKVPGRWLRA